MRSIWFVIVLMVETCCVAGYQVDAAADAYCREVGSGGSNIPGTHAECAGAQQARFMTADSKWYCIGTLGGDSISCPRHNELLAVRRAAEYRSGGQSLQNVLDDHCTHAGPNDGVDLGDESSSCHGGARKINGQWRCSSHQRRRRAGPGYNTYQCVNNDNQIVATDCPQATESYCIRHDRLELVVWSYLNGPYTTTTTTTTTTSTTSTSSTSTSSTTWPLPVPVPLCPVGQIRYFNDGECFANCPPYAEEKEVNGEQVCLPTITHAASTMENSVLTMETGADGLYLRIQHPLLPLKYAENVTVINKIDMRSHSSELHNVADSASCNGLWQPVFFEDDYDDNEWHPNAVHEWNGRKHHGEFSANQTVLRRLEFQPNSEVRLSMSLTFFGELESDNTQDAVLVLVNGVEREVHWPMLGRTQGERQVRRHHLCYWGNAASDHCWGSFHFDAETDDAGVLDVSIVGSPGSKSDGFTWAFTNFTVKLPMLETTLTFANLSQHCQLGTAVDGQHIVRSGSVGLSVMGSWVNSQHELVQQELNRVSFPVRVLFPQWVTGTYLPITVWVETIAPEITGTAKPFVATLGLFETASFTEARRVPRYEQNSSVFAQHCLEEPGLGLELVFKQLLLSTDSDPTNITAYQFNLTDEVTTIPNNIPECAQFFFTAVQPCEWCTLHVFGIVRSTTRRLGREQPNRKLQSAYPHLSTDGESGYAVNSGAIIVAGHASSVTPPGPILYEPVEEPQEVLEEGLLEEDSHAGRLAIGCTAILSVFLHQMTI